MRFPFSPIMLLLAVCLEAASAVERPRLMRRGEEALETPGDEESDPHEAMDFSRGFDAEASALHRTEVTASGEVMQQASFAADPAPALPASVRAVAATVVAPVFTAPAAAAPAVAAPAVAAPAAYPASTLPAVPAGTVAVSGGAAAQAQPVAQAATASLPVAPAVAVPVPAAPVLPATSPTATYAPVAVTVAAPAAAGAAVPATAAAVAPAAVVSAAVAPAAATVVAPSAPAAPAKVTPETGVLYSLLGFSFVMLLIITVVYCVYRRSFGLGPATPRGARELQGKSALKSSFARTEAEGGAGLSKPADTAPVKTSYRDRRSQQAPAGDESAPTSPGSPASPASPASPTPYSARRTDPPAQEASAAPSPASPEARGSSYRARREASRVRSGSEHSGASQEVPKMEDNSF